MSCSAAYNIYRYTLLSLSTNSSACRGSSAIRADSEFRALNRKWELTRLLMALNRACHSAFNNRSFPR
jgi:hypothetical protein